MLNAQKKQYSGDITDGAKKRLNRAVTLMCQAIKPKWIMNPVTNRYQYHRMSFITLTVSSSKNITAKEAYPILLKPFLRWMREQKGVKVYIWKAELQERGQLHYHITVPDFLHWQEIRNYWNGLQREAGLLDEYAEKTKHFDANSTDVHETRKVKDMAAYLVKELSKTVNGKRLKAIRVVDSLIKAGEIPKEQRKKFIDDYTGQELKMEGKIWDCSDNLSGVKYFALPLRSEVGDMLKFLYRAGETKEKRGDWWTIIQMPGHSPPTMLLNESEQKEFDRHIGQILQEQTPEDITQAIPADLLQPAIDQALEYTWKQVSLLFN